jgi:undecaprenyl-diphosphatase
MLIKRFLSVQFQLDMPHASPARCTLMPLVHAIILGIVQGLTEFLPVSSSAHLIIVPWILGWDDGGLTFDVALHVGTLAAVVLFFFRDWVQIIAQGFGWSAGDDLGLSKNRGLLWLLAAGTIPGGVAGLLFERQAESALRSPYIIAAAAIVVGLIMWLADSAGRKENDISRVSLADSLTVGVAQAFAIIPGVSRSGSTISAGLLRDLDRTTAARFSFLLSTPIIAGAAAKKGWELMKHGGGLPHDMQIAFLAGILVSAITGGLTIAFFLNFLRRRSLASFVWYRIVFGIIVIALAFIRRPA